MKRVKWEILPKITRDSSSVKMVKSFHIIQNGIFTKIVTSPDWNGILFLRERSERKKRYSGKREKAPQIKNQNYFRRSQLASNKIKRRCFILKKF